MLKPICNLHSLPTNKDDKINGSGIFKGFDMEKFFDKESLIDTLNTLYVEGDISDKDYRMWYKLNCKTRISVLTTVEETHANAAFAITNLGH